MASQRHSLKLTDEQLRALLANVETILDEVAQPDEVKDEPYVRELVMWTSCVTAAMGAIAGVIARSLF